MTSRKVPPALAFSIRIRTSQLQCYERSLPSSSKLVEAMRPHELIPELSKQLKCKPPLDISVLGTKSLPAQCSNCSSISQCEIIAGLLQKMDFRIQMLFFYRIQMMDNGFQLKFLQQCVWWVSAFKEVVITKLAESENFM